MLVICPFASYFNHSCKPNCFTEIDGNILSIYSKENIKQGK